MNMEWQTVVLCYLIQAKKMDVDFRGDSLVANKRTCGKHYSWFLELSIIEFLYRFLKMIVGNSFRDESICCQILGRLNLIDLFPYWEQTGWQKDWPEVERLVWWVCTELTAVNRRSNVLDILLLWKLCISLAISSWYAVCYPVSINLIDRKGVLHGIGKTWWSWLFCYGWCLVCVSWFLLLNPKHQWHTSSISYQIKTDIPNVLNDSESLWIEINLHKKICIIVVMYRHPGYDISAFTENTCEILHNFSDKKLPFIICGDININLMQQNAISQVRNYVNAYKSCNCLKFITKPTIITPSSCTLIDHVYTTLPLDKVIPGILINDLSDHLPIFVLIKPAHVDKLNTKAQFIMISLISMQKSSWRKQRKH